MLLLSPAATEGISARHVQVVRLMEPQWSSTTTEQVIFRAIRLGSHSDLELHERAVTPVQYMGYVQREIDSHPRELQNLQ